jgi:hypothetical protein
MAPVPQAGEPLVGVAPLNGLAEPGLGAALFGGMSAGRASPTSLPGGKRRISREIFGAEHQAAGPSRSPSASPKALSPQARSPVLRFANSPALMGISAPADASGMQALTLDAGGMEAAAPAPKINFSVKIS